jgi:sulfur relay protein TusB/DsrH
MQTYVILATLDTLKLPLIISVAEKVQKMNLILLSDAVLLLDDLSNESFFKSLEKYDVSIIVTKDDLEKRLSRKYDKVQIVDYKTLVNLVLSDSTRTFNF